MQIKEVPQDVQEIISYTELRKKHRKQDQQLRQNFKFPQDAITFEQMRILLIHFKK